MSTALSNEARGELERYIDWFVNTGIPQIMSRFKTKEVKNILQYQNEDDFSFGVAYGAIFSGMEKSFLQRFIEIRHKQNRLKY